MLKWFFKPRKSLALPRCSSVSKATSASRVAARTFALTSPPPRLVRRCCCFFRRKRKKNTPRHKWWAGDRKRIVPRVRLRVDCDFRNLDGPTQNKRGSQLKDSDWIVLGQDRFDGGKKKVKHTHKKNKQTLVCGDVQKTCLTMGVFSFFPPIPLKLCGMFYMSDSPRIVLGFFFSPWQPKCFSLIIVAIFLSFFFFLLKSRVLLFFLFLRESEREREEETGSSCGISSPSHRQVLLFRRDSSRHASSLVCRLVRFFFSCYLFWIISRCRTSSWIHKGEKEHWQSFRLSQDVPSLNRNTLQSLFLLLAIMSSSLMFLPEAWRGEKEKNKQKKNNAIYHSVATTFPTHCIHTECIDRWVKWLEHFYYLSSAWEGSLTKLS